MFKVLRSAGLSTSPSVGPSRRFMMSRTMLWIVRRRLRKCEDETSGYTTNTKCSKWPKEVCTVSKKPVKKYTPITGCTKEPRELCAPAGCGFKQGEEECYDKTQTVVQDAPKEQCSLEPQRTCKHVTKLVPK